MIDLSVLERDGAVLATGVLSREQVEALAGQLDPLFSGVPGRRVFADAHVTKLASHGGLLWRLAAACLGPDTSPVRAIAFDKTAAANWTVGWHQDRTVAVARRIDADGFGPWSAKDGVAHVEPPSSVMSRMRTIRLHLDDCGPDNAPLLVARGSHALGRVDAREAARTAENLLALTCLAEAGDAWVYMTPVLHASKPSRGQGRRRVLQIDYADFDLPGGLQWAGIG